jgi:hypothetical protein
VGIPLRIVDGPPPHWTGERQPGMMRRRHRRAGAVARARLAAMAATLRDRQRRVPVREPVAA